MTSERTCRVTACVPPGLAVDVDGQRVEIQSPHGLMPRMDVVVRETRFDLDAPAFKAVMGVPSFRPLPPALISNDSVRQELLAFVTVNRQQWVVQDCHITAADPASSGGGLMTDDTKISRYSVPGHDRDCLTAMRSQVQLGRPLDRVQVDHLLDIAWRAGATAEHDAMYEGVTEDCRPLFDYARVLAQTGSSGDEFLDHVAWVYGPTLRWRRRLRLAVHLAFRKGYPR